MPNAYWEIKEVEVAINGTFSSAFTLESYAIFYGALFPSMDNGNIGLELSIDNGGNYYPILDPADGDDAILCNTGSDPGWIDFSDWIRFVGDNTEYKLRFTCAAQVSGAVTIKIIMRG